VDLCCFLAINCQKKILFTIHFSWCTIKCCFNLAHSPLPFQHCNNCNLFIVTTSIGLATSFNFKPQACHSHAWTLPSRWCLSCLQCYK
jgi:hypothetical protein